MELIQSFIAILESGAKQQASQENTNSTTAHQPSENTALPVREMNSRIQRPQSQESVAVEALLFNKPLSTVQTAPHVNVITNENLLPD